MEEYRKRILLLLKNEGLSIDPSISNVLLFDLLVEKGFIPDKKVHKKETAKVILKKFISDKDETYKNFITKERNKKLKRRKKRKKVKLNKSSHDEFFQSWEWAEVRFRAIQMYARKCMCCGASPNDGVVLQVDHIKPRSKFPELSLDINNLQILCNICNKGKGNWDYSDFRM